MGEEIRVSVIEKADRKYYQLRWVDPLTGQEKTRSSGVVRTGLQKDRDKAVERAGKLKAELEEGRYAPRNRMTWEGFREQYETDVIPGLAEATEKKAASVLNWVESVLHPSKLADLTAPRLAHLQAKMREANLAEDSIRGNLAHLKAALNWAVRMGLLSKAPKIDMPKRAKGSKAMKGRPITLEEFERMLAKIPEALTEKPNKRRKTPKPPTAGQIASWDFYVRGLWLSGLRLAESLQLTWDRQDKLRVDLDGKRPMLRIPAELEKGHKDRLLPMAPEFAELLLTVPADRRTGYVFTPLPVRPERAGRLGELQVGRFVSSLGELAKVKVNTTVKKDDKGKPVEVVKYASAHDLRRAFGFRWSARVMPAVLQQLMRHESIETTLRYYVGRNAEATADILWEAHAKASGRDNSGARDIFRDIGQNQPSANEKPLAGSSDSVRGSS